MESNGQLVYEPLCWFALHAKSTASRPRKNEVLSEMKTILEKGAERVELQRAGRVVFVLHPDGSETEHGYFDGAAAEAGLELMIQRRRAEGWVEPPSIVAARAARERAAKEDEERLAMQLAKYSAWVEAPDAKTAFRQLAGGLFVDAPEEFERLVSKVVALSTPAATGVTVHLEGGAEIEWFVPEITLFRDAQERNEDDPALRYGEGLGPPLGDGEIRDQVSGEITWFLDESIYRHWFFTDEAPNIARLWEHDGGIDTDAPERSPTQVLAARLVALAGLD
jgi:hypothetical protein